MTQEKELAQGNGPARELTFGEKAVRMNFNPDNNPTVLTIKRLQANYIDYLNQLRTQSDNPEIKRMLSLAITEGQSSQHWATMAATWPY